MSTLPKQSEIKANIVSKCFFAWARVMKSNRDRFRGLAAPTINYIDLYAGRGRYDDGSLSTPLLILQKAIADSDMSKILVSHFNDKDEKNCSALLAAINELENIKTLTHSPRIYNGEVDVSIEAAFQKIRMAPTFFFLDPWGYKGLSLTLIKSLLKDWRTDGIFFFSYMSIRRGLSIKSVQKHMFALFGKERVLGMREAFEKLTPKECEQLICCEMDAALRELGAKYTLFFRFKHPERNRTSHYLVFVTKDFLGYSIMKDIMAKEGLAIDDIPLFYFDSDAEGFKEQYQTSLLTEKHPIETLQDEILIDCKGMQLTRPQVYERHTNSRQSLYQIYEHHLVGSPFQPRHYTKALLALAEQGKITFDRKPKKGTLAETIRITFP